MLIKNNWITVWISYFLHLVIKQLRARICLIMGPEVGFHYHRSGSSTSFSVGRQSMSLFPTITRSHLALRSQWYTHLAIWLPASIYRNLWTHWWERVWGLCIRFRGGICSSKFDTCGPFWVSATRQTSVSRTKNALNELTESCFAPLKLIRARLTNNQIKKKHT